MPGRYYHFLSGPVYEKRRIFQVRSSKHLPQIIQSLQWPGLKKHDHVEPTIVVRCLGYERKPQRITGGH